MRITYVGHYRRVQVPELDRTVARGETVAVSDTDLAKRLLKQDANWREAVVPDDVAWPDDGWTNERLVDWLEARGIEAPVRATKSELLDLVQGVEE